MGITCLLYIRLPLAGNPAPASLVLIPATVRASVHLVPPLAATSPGKALAEATIPLPAGTIPTPLPPLTTFLLPLSLLGVLPAASLTTAAGGNNIILARAASLPSVTFAAVHSIVLYKHLNIQHRRPRIRPRSAGTTSWLSGAASAAIRMR
jgi:hypothetical protein